MDSEKILFVNACVRPDSRTYELAQCLLEGIPGEVCELNLYAEDIQPMDIEALNERTRWLKEKRYDHPSLSYARRFAGADAIVIAAPYWDLLFPAVLRTYLEVVTASGISFAYSPEGRLQGLCRAKRLYYVTTAGGYIGENNFGFEYIKALAQGLYGIPDVRLVSAEGLDIAGADIEQIMERAKESIAKAD